MFITSSRHLLSRAAIVGALLAPIGACATTAAGPPAGPRVDGVYTGESTLTRGWGYDCSSPSYPLSIPVKDGRFDYTILVSPLGNPPVPVQIYADGSLHGQTIYKTEDYWSGSSSVVNQWILINGHVDGSTLDATVQDYRCTRHLTLHRT
jgi:hypothetical protein